MTAAQDVLPWMMAAATWHDIANEMQRITRDLKRLTYMDYISAGWQPTFACGHNFVVTIEGETVQGIPLGEVPHERPTPERRP